jgi:tRNA1Val (adenine37-N6)-methyltransferase
MIELNENESLEDLQFKGLKIIQDKTNYRFTSDAVLLSSFAHVKSGETLCEFCSGSGVISILINAKCGGIKQIYMVEISPRLAEMSRKSIEYNNLNNMQVLNIPVQQAHKHINGIDVIVCNPPYNKTSQKIPDIDSDIAAARWEVLINIKEIMQAAKSILRFKGRFYIVHQAARAAEIIYEMKNHGIEPKTLRTVQAKADREPHLVLIEGVRGGSGGLKICKPLIIYGEDGGYTQEANKLYNIKG